MQINLEIVLCVSPIKGVSILLKYSVSAQEGLRIPQKLSMHRFEFKTSKVYELSHICVHIIPRNYIQCSLATVPMYLIWFIEHNEGSLIFRLWSVFKVLNICTHNLSIGDKVTLDVGWVGRWKVCISCNALNDSCTSNFPYKTGQISIV